MQPSEMSLIRENQRLKQEVSSLKEKLKRLAHEEHLNHSQAMSKSNRSVSGLTKKSLSPRYEPLKRVGLNKQFNVSPNSKLRSTGLLNQDNYVNVNHHTPPKSIGPKSYHDLESKSQNMSVDELPPRRTKKAGKEKTFESKIRMFMERNEVDRDL